MGSSRRRRISTSANVLYVRSIWLFFGSGSTRGYTLDKAFYLQQKVEASIGKVPFILLVNKSDLIDEWEIDDRIIENISQKNWLVIKSSAKTGLGVEEAFFNITEKMLEEIDALSS